MQNSAFRADDCFSPHEWLLAFVELHVGTELLKLRTASSVLEIADSGRTKEKTPYTCRHCRSHIDCHFSPMSSKQASNRAPVCASPLLYGTISPAGPVMPRCSRTLYRLPTTFSISLLLSLHHPITSGRNHGCRRSDLPSNGNTLPQVRGDNW